MSIGFEEPMCKSVTLAGLLLPLCLVLCSCGQGNSTRLDYQMGEKVSLGPLTYTVIQTSWRNQLGEGFKVRTPQHRFLLINISVTNGGGKEVALPLFKLQDEQDKLITESDNTEGVPDGIGILRSVTPAQTLQGALLFDVPLSKYRLQLTDGGEPGSEKLASVVIPLVLDVDPGVQPPAAGTLK
jgi:hypothetical protein